MISTDLPWGVKPAGAWVWQSYCLRVPVIWKSWEPQHSGNLGASVGLYRESFTFYKWECLRILSDYSMELNCKFPICLWDSTLVAKKEYFVSAVVSSVGDLIFLQQFFYRIRDFEDWRFFSWLVFRDGEIPHPATHCHILTLFTICLT
jgi:hypothetical protein